MCNALGMQICKSCKTGLGHLLHCLPLCQLSSFTLNFCCQGLRTQQSLVAIIASKKLAAVLRSVTSNLYAWCKRPPGRQLKPRTSLEKRVCYLVCERIQDAEKARIFESCQGHMQISMLNVTALQDKLLYSLQRLH